MKVSLLALCECHIPRHPREGGDPVPRLLLDSRLRGNDEFIRACIQPVADIGRASQELSMKTFHPLGLFLVPALVGCAGSGVDGSEICTVEAVGKETGTDGLDAVLHVPESFLRGVDISDGGISVWNENCDFPLNAFFSDETSRYVIENAPQKTLSHREGFFRVVDASLSIRKFSDGSGETRFFVTGVHEMRPILKARTSHQAKYYLEPSDGK